MKEYYQECKKCGNLLPLLTYFLSKEENQKLTEEERSWCHNCYVLIRKPNSKEAKDLRKISN